jgi:hypothetical protein
MPKTSQQRREQTAEREELRRQKAEVVSRQANVQFGDEFVISHRTGLPVATLRTWRSLGRGPRYIKVGRRVLYDIAAVDRWLSLQAVATSGST